MIPQHFNIRSVKPAHLQALVEGGVQEGLQLDFKLDAYNNDIEEWCKDISAFANTDGGVIAMGIRDDNGVATEVIGIPRADVDKRIRALTQKACSAIQPVPSIDYHPVELESGRTVLLAAAPPSRHRPHACRYGTRFYKRMPRNVEDMNRQDLNAAFSGSIGQEEAALAIHTPRVENQMQASTDALTVILDFIPTPPDQERFDPLRVDQLGAVRKLLEPTDWSMAENRIMFDGLRYVRDGREDLSFLRTGSSLMMWHVRPHPPQHERALPAVDFCERTISFVVQAMQLLRVVDPSSPAHLCMSILRCNQWTLDINQRTFFADTKPIEFRSLTLPVLYWDGIDGSTETVMGLLRPWFHRLWNACGLVGCHLYKREDGTPDWPTFSRWR